MVRHAAMNWYKHHLGFLRERIEKVNRESDIPDLKRDLLVAGHGLTDLYTGTLMPDEIIGGIIGHLLLEGVSTSGEYGEWIRADGSDYRVVVLKEGTRWILRAGKTDERFIHIHPARNSPDTVRVRALTLKTSVLVSALVRVRRSDTVSLDLINTVRRELLGESPVSGMDGCRGILKILQCMNGL